MRADWPCLDATLPVPSLGVAVQAEHTAVCSLRHLVIGRAGGALPRGRWPIPATATPDLWRAEAVAMAGPSNAARRVAGVVLTRPMAVAPLRQTARLEVHGGRP